ncbi:hypothetical protein ACGYTZ_28500, partial [Burkholderia pseudomallei]
MRRVKFFTAGRRAARIRAREAAHCRRRGREPKKDGRPFGRPPQEPLRDATLFRCGRNHRAGVDDAHAQRAR